MKVIGIVGSPRTDGNVSTLVNQVLEGAAESGHPTEEYRLNEMSFSGCQACNYCKSHDRCKQDDDMSELMERLKVADAVVFGSPIYYWQFASQFRTFIDRLYMFFGSDGSVSLAPGKKAVVVTSQGDVGVESFSGVFAEFDKLLRYYGFEKVGEMHVTNGNSPSAARSNKELMEEARAIGKAL